MRQWHIANGGVRIFSHIGVRLFKLKGIIYLSGVLTGARRLADDLTLANILQNTGYRERSFRFHVMVPTVL
jgi:hypothetical protein